MPGPPANAAESLGPPFHNKRHSGLKRFGGNQPVAGFVAKVRHVDLGHRIVSEETDPRAGRQIV